MIAFRVIRRALVRLLPVAVLMLTAASGLAQVETEPFGPAGFTNPFFQHQFAVDDSPEWEVQDLGGGDWQLHLQSNVDFVTWTLPPGKLVSSVSCLLTDLETEPGHPEGFSAFTVRSSWVGDIVEIRLQAEIVGGATALGAFWDDLTVSLVDSAFGNVGSGLAGTHGVPTLLGESTLEPGALIKLTTSGALENAAVALVAGTSVLGASFKGGVLVPQPDVIVSGLSTNADGVLTISSTWPAGVPTGFELHVQMWISDPAGPAGFAATNAVTGVAP